MKRIRPTPAVARRQPSARRLTRRLACLAAACTGPTLWSVAGAQPSELPAAAPAASSASPQTTRPADLPRSSEPSTPSGLLPLWEAGLGAATMSLPDYRGSAHRRTLTLPLPYVVYRGEWLRADREGARAVLVDAQRLEVDLSAAATAPASSDDNPKRAGMADLPATLEIGPNANLTLWRAAAASLQGSKLELRLPLRGVFTVEGRPRDIGVVFEPTLNLDVTGFATGGGNLGLQAGLLYGSRRYHQHFYGVAEDEARPDRPAYRADAGYAGWKLLAAWSRRQGPLWFGAFLRRDQLAGAVFADSPLVERRQPWSAGLALAWIFASSERLVPGTDR